MYDHERNSIVYNLDKTQNVTELIRTFANNTESRNQELKNSKVNFSSLCTIRQREQSIHVSLNGCNFRCLLLENFEVLQKRKQNTRFEWSLHNIIGHESIFHGHQLYRISSLPMTTQLTG